MCGNPGKLSRKEADSRRCNQRLEREGEVLAEDLQV